VVAERREVVGERRMFKSTTSPLLGHYGIPYLLFTGVGVWGNNIPVGWAWEHYPLVFWIGTGHAGTMISAILHLCRQKMAYLDQPLSRSHDTFAVMCAEIFPAIHTGRIWMIWFCSGSKPKLDLAPFSQLL
jgi:hypothetical protein